MRLTLCFGSINQEPLKRSLKGKIVPSFGILPASYSRKRRMERELKCCFSGHYPQTLNPSVAPSELVLGVGRGIPFLESQGVSGISQQTPAVSLNLVLCLASLQMSPGPRVESLDLALESIVIIGSILGL